MQWDISIPVREMRVKHWNIISGQKKENHSYCFPNRIEEVLILQDALRLNIHGAKAAYSLGNFWYANRQYDNAIACWEHSAAINPAYPTVWRNLSLAYYNKRDDKQKALETLEKAYALDEHDSRILMELDQLYKAFRAAA